MEKRATHDGPIVQKMNAPPPGGMFIFACWWQRPQTPLNSSIPELAARPYGTLLPGLVLQVGKKISSSKETEERPVQSKTSQIEVDYSHPDMKLYPATVFRFQSIAPHSPLVLYLRKYEATIATELCRPLPQVQDFRQLVEKLAGGQTGSVNNQGGRNRHPMRPPCPRLFQFLFSRSSRLGSYLALDPVSEVGTFKSLKENQ